VGVRMWVFLHRHAHQRLHQYKSTRILLGLFRIASPKEISCCVYFIFVNQSEVALSFKSLRNHGIQPLMWRMIVLPLFCFLSIFFISRTMRVDVELSKFYDEI